MKITIAKASVETVKRRSKQLLFRVSREAGAANPEPLHWPTIKARNKIEILDDGMGYVRHGIVTTVNKSAFYFRPAKDDKHPKPMPPVEGEVYSLPATVGHAHHRSWKEGSFVEIHGRYYRVVRVASAGDKLIDEFQLSPATEEQYRERSGRILLKVHAEEAEFQIGRCFQIGDEWLEIKSIEKTNDGNGEHDQLFGLKCYGIGNFTTAEKARKLNLEWQLAAKVRLLEWRLRIAKNADSERAMNRIEVELARVKRTASFLAARQASK